MATKPFPQASNSNTKVLEKLGVAKIGVLHMACFKIENAFYVASSKKIIFSWVGVSKQLQFY